MGRNNFRMATLWSWIIFNFFILFPHTMADSSPNGTLTGENDYDETTESPINTKILLGSDASVLESLISSVTTALQKIEVIDKKLDEDHQALWREIKALKSGQGGAGGSIDANTKLDTILRPRDCAEIQLKADDPSKLDSSISHTIFPFGPQGKGVKVRCDFQTAGGGWTIIQRRRSGPKEEFYRDWAAYEEGFGSVMGNYWIGLKVIHILTSTSPQSLRVELGDWDGRTGSANYGNFSVGSSNESYILRISGYWGDAGDAGNSMGWHRGQKFYTKDKDNAHNCAQRFHGAWWYDRCAVASLNGYYYPSSSTPSPPTSDGLFWYHWKNQWGYSLKSSEMKIRGLGVF